MEYFVEDFSHYVDCPRNLCIDFRNNRRVSIKTEKFLQKFTNFGWSIHDLDLPAELSIPEIYWTAFCRASDFAMDMRKLLEEIKAQGILTPFSRVDMGKALDLFEFPTYVQDLILDFTEPMSSSMMAEEIFREQNRWKSHDRSFSYNFAYGAMMSNDPRIGRAFVTGFCPDKSWNGYRSHMSEFGTLKDRYWIRGRSEKKSWFIRSMFHIILDDSDCVQLDRYRIGFFEITGICDCGEPGRTVRFCNDLSSRELYRDVNYEKTLVLYDTYTCDGYDMWTPMGFQPPHWNEYFSKFASEFDLKTFRFGQQPVRIKFTSGPTIREIIYQDVQNDVKFVTSNMVKELISYLQADTKWWVLNLLNELKIGEKQWQVVDGALKEMGDASGKEIVEDPFENSKESRRQKYARDQKFRQKHVNSKNQATKRLKS